MALNLPEKYKDCDFAGWATRNDIRCKDGRTIRRDAFAHQDGAKVPLVWGHNHDSPQAVLGHGFLENRPEGVFMYGYFNDSEDAQRAKTDVAHGDVTSLSIWANQLKEKGGDVLHGSIKEVSLVLAGANLGAQITYPVIVHGEDAEVISDEAYITFGDELSRILTHSDMEGESSDSGDSDSNTAEQSQEVSEDSNKETDKRSTSEMDDIQEILNGMSEEQLNAVSYLVDKAGDEALAHADLSHADDEDNDDETVQDVLDTMNDKQRKVVAYLVSEAATNGLDDDDEDGDAAEHSDFGGDSMNFNAFESGTAAARPNYISHSDQKEILDVAKKYGKLSDAIAAYAEDHQDVLSHDDLAPVSGFGSYPENGNPAVVDKLFPEFHNMRPGAPELVTDDDGWVGSVLSGISKIPYNRIRTNYVDIRGVEELRAKGYVKGKQKTLVGSYDKVIRETTPQTIYVRSTLNQDDIEDITDFSYVDFQYKIDRMQMNTELARAILVGDGRVLGSPDKIKEDKIRPIWTDEDVYTIHKVLKLDANANGSNTAANFGNSFRYAEAVEELLLDAKIDYRGSGSLAMYCTQQFWNKMILARDLNGRRIYSNKNELMTALDVNSVHAVPEFQNKTRTVNGKTYRLLAILGNLKDYTFGSVKNGEITHRTQFDIDFNQQKSLLETRGCGAVTKLYSFIVIEEEVTTNSGNNENP
jgi:hypothetical protein